MQVVQTDVGEGDLLQSQGSPVNAARGLVELGPGEVEAGRWEGLLVGQLDLQTCEKITLCAARNFYVQVYSVYTWKIMCILYMYITVNTCTQPQWLRKVKKIKDYSLNMA